MGGETGTSPRADAHADCNPDARAHGGTCQTLESTDCFPGAAGTGCTTGIDRITGADRSAYGVPDVRAHLDNGTHRRADGDGDGHAVTDRNAG